MLIVAGVCNVEISFPVDGWPVEYVPVRYPRGQIGVVVSGVGFGVARGLGALGVPVQLATFVADDPLGQVVHSALVEHGLWGDLVVPATSTPRSVVLVAADGSRCVSTDLREMPDAVYPVERFAAAVGEAEWAVVTNIGFARPLLAAARQAGVPVAADVQAIDDLHDPYNAEWMDAAEALFCSHERLPMPAEEWARAVHKTYGCRFVVVGMGAEGALLSVAGREPRLVPAVAPRGVVNTVGAGDALSAAFLAALVRTGDPDRAIEYAVTFAGYRVGAQPGTAEALCSWGELTELARAQGPGVVRSSSR